jgi:hypothetical protein
MADVFEIEVELSGKITDPALGDDMVAKARDGLVELLEIEGVGNVQSQLYPGHGYESGKLHDSIGYSVDGLSGQIDAGRSNHGRNLNYAAWVEGVDPRNASSSFRGYGMFEKTRRHLESIELYKQYVGDEMMELFN